MTHDDLVFEALCYLRNVGATPDDIRSYVLVREVSPHDKTGDNAVLRRLESSAKAVKVGKRWYLSPAGRKLARGQALDPEWQSEDAWILLAVIYGSRGSEPTLDQVIGAADRINHAIPTLDEMHGALNRLATAALLTVQDDIFLPTEKALTLLARVEARSKKGLLDVWKNLFRVLVCPCCGIPLTSVRWQVFVDEGALRASYVKYSKTAGAT